MDLASFVDVGDFEQPFKGLALVCCLQAHQWHFEDTGIAAGALRDPSSERLPIHRQTVSLEELRRRVAGVQRRLSSWETIQSKRLLESIPDALCNLLALTHACQ